MVFTFRVNKSFLKEGGNHPITVPTAEHRRLRAENLDTDRITVILPRGERFKGKIYQGISKGESYYQLWFAPQVKRWNGNGLPSYLKIGDSLLVVLFKDEEKTYAALELQ